MKKTASLLLALGAAGAACGQSSVTFYGTTDLTLRHTSNAGTGSITSLASGGNSTSKFGFRGTEDLGGGMSASFWFESGVAADNGSVGLSPRGLFFDRRSTVSLHSKRFGELRLGRDLVTSYANWGRFDPFAYVGVASASNLITATPNGPIKAAFGSSPNTTVRSSNSIQYVLPSNSLGLEGGLMAAPDEEGTAANNQHKYFGGRLGLRSGRFYVSAAHGVSENDLTQGEKFKDTALGAMYDFGEFRISGAVRQFRFRDAKQTNLLLGANIKAGAGEVRLSWNRASLSGNNLDGNDADQIGLGYVHNLSKRTAVYASYAYLRNKGNANFTVMGGSGISAGGSSRGIDFGLRNHF